jgi:hypothetical protein
MNRFLCEELKVPDDQREIHLNTLCAGIVNMLGYDCMRLILWRPHGANCYRPTYDGEDLNVREKLVAAMAVGEHKLVEELLPQIDNFTFPVRYQSPVIAVVMIGDDNR